MPQRTQTVGYVRVSSDDQNLARQLEAIGEVDRVFSDKVSGGSRNNRTALDECTKYIRDGDTVRVASMDRLARSLRDMRDIVDEIIGKGAAVQFVKEGQTYSPDTNDPLSQLMLHMLGAFAEFERALIRERQAEGIRIAKAEGRYRGRARKLTPVQLDEARQLISTGVPKAEVARRYEVDRSTLHRALADPQQ
ncbi:recombinase family protein [Microbacterium sp. 2C]|uniref:recombinase family protein n=1 Tax=Microbacterium paulum TaxID=2707006 RepID=UPI0018C22A2A|nr:recombinase family protein [Microbacterium paulum]MBG0718178.1 recombinase family protein [Microbacterium paulum]